MGLQQFLVWAHEPSRSCFFYLCAMIRVCYLKPKERATTQRLLVHAFSPCTSSGCWGMMAWRFCARQTGAHQGVNDLLEESRSLLEEAIGSPMRWKKCSDREGVCKGRCTAELPTQDTRDAEKHTPLWHADAPPAGLVCRAGVSA